MARLRLGEPLEDGVRPTRARRLGGTSRRESHAPERGTALLVEDVEADRVLVGGV